MTWAGDIRCKGQWVGIGRTRDENRGQAVHREQTTFPTTNPCVKLAMPDTKLTKVVAG